jgi:hypothetical protein
MHIQLGKAGIIPRQTAGLSKPLLRAGVKPAETSEGEGFVYQRIEQPGQRTWSSADRRKQLV